MKTVTDDTCARAAWSCDKLIRPMLGLPAVEHITRVLLQQIVMAAMVEDGLEIQVAGCPVVVTVQAKPRSGSEAAA